MKKDPISQSGVFNPRVLLAFALCSAGVLLAMLSFAAPTPGSGITASAANSPGDSLLVGKDAGPLSGHANAAATGNWSIVSSPNNGSPGTNFLFATACAAASDCWAVGYSQVVGGDYETLIERWDGAVWAIISSPNSSGNNILHGVTCLSPLHCWAVGDHSEVNGSAQRTVIEHWDGNAWSLVTSPNRGLSSPPIDALDGVTCVSASECWAVGLNDASNGVGQTLVQRWDGASWTIVASPNHSGSDSLYSITCPSPAECWAVGDTATNLGSVQTLIEKWDGAVWSIVSSPNNGGYDSLRSVTCASESDCWAVGYYVTNNLHTLIEHWDGNLWTIVTSPNTSAV